MRILLFISFLTLWTQAIQGDTFQKSRVDASLMRPQRDSEQLRSLADLWNSVKQSAVNAWESVRNIAKHTGERIRDWIQMVKVKAKDLNALFKSRLQDMKEEINNLIASMKVTGELVKQCIKKEQDTINEILKELLKSVTTCISESIQYLPLTDESCTQLLIEKTDFISNVENELYLCLNDEDVEQCFNDVRKNVYNQLELEEKNILKNRDETRAAADEILNTIASCTSNGLIEASASVTNTTIQIIKCVSKG